TKFLQDMADLLKQYSGDPLVATGQNIHDAIFRVAVILALLVALPPILLVLLPYTGWRWRDIRETGAALAFVRIASMTGRADAARVRQALGASRGCVRGGGRRDHPRGAAAAREHRGQPGRGGTPGARPRLVATIQAFDRDTRG